MGEDNNRESEKAGKQESGKKIKTEEGINFDALVMWLVFQEELPSRGPRGSSLNLVRLRSYYKLIDEISCRLIEDEEYRCESVKRYLLGKRESRKAGKREKD